MSSSAQPKQRLIHICPLDRNVGDNALNLAIDRMLRPSFRIEHMELVGNPFDEQAFRRLDRADVVLFGGGGVIHSASGGASRKNRERTGTMWNMELELIERLSSKIVLYSTGFNRFEGEPPPLEQMGQFFEVLDRKRALVSFRNDRSKERFLDFFPQFDGIRVTPDPGLFARIAETPIRGDYALVQIAVDRLEYRYPGGIEQFLELIAKLRELSPVPLYLIPHTTADLKIYTELGSKIPVDGVFGDLTPAATTETAMRLYRNALFTISTRGHSQICSIGNGTPTFALSTHPKAAGFMDEVGQAAATHDYLTGSDDQALERFAAFLARLPEIRQEIASYLVTADSQISDFNRNVVDYAYRDWEPPRLLTQPDAVPREQPASLEAEREQARIRAEQKAAESGEQADSKPSVPSTTEYAYLPRRTAKFGAGTYSAATGAPSGQSREIPGEPMLPAAANVKGARIQRSSDGATCGVVVSCDANYYPGVTTCIAAIRSHNPRLPITFLDAGLTPEQRADVTHRVDAYRKIDELDGLSLSTFPSHLSAAALSSLYTHLAGYDKCLYVDVDALVLGDLSPMFEALSTDYDVVGIRGNQFGWLADGYRHTVANELESGSVEVTSAIFPRVDITQPAINSGCFAVWSKVSEAWMPDARSLMSQLRLFRTADQALLNVLMPMRGLRLRLVDGAYNTMGFQLTTRRHWIQGLTTELDMSMDHCSLRLGGKDVVVAHFAGRSKPWMASIDEPASLAWDWHAATTPMQRRVVVLRAQLLATSSEAEFLAAVERGTNREMLGRKVDPFDLVLEAANVARRLEYFQASEQLFRKALELHKTSKAALRGLVQIAARTGDVQGAAKIVEASLAGSTHPSVVRFQRDTLPAALDGTPPEATEGKSSSTAVTASRASRRTGGSGGPVSLAAGSFFSEPKAEVRVLRNSELGIPDVVTIEQVLASYLDDAEQDQRSASEAVRLAASRLEVIAPAVGSVTRVGQLGAGRFALLESLARSANAAAVAFATGAERPSYRAAAELAPLDTLGGAGLDSLLAVSVLDRVTDQAAALAWLASGVKDGGCLIVVDTISAAARGDVTEGLAVFAPRGPVASLETLAATAGLSVERVWIRDGERIVLLRRIGQPAPIPVPPEVAQFVATIGEAVAAVGSGERSAPVGLVDVVPIPKAPDAGNWSDADTSTGQITVQRPADDVIQDVDAASQDELRAEESDGEALPADEQIGQGAIVLLAPWRSPRSTDRLIGPTTEVLIGRHLSKAKVLKWDLDRELTERAARAAGLIAVTGDILDSSFLNWLRPRPDLAIRGPVALFGVGLGSNLDDSVFDEPGFAEGVRHAAELAVLLGMRDQHTADRVASLLPQPLASKVVVQPSPLSVLPILRPGSLLKHQRKAKATKHIFVNPAFDHPDVRFGSGFAEALARLERVVDGLLDAGHRVSIVGHVSDDLLLHSVVRRRREVGRINLVGRTLDQTLVGYRDADLVISMRSQSQEFALGLGVPVVTIVTAPSLQWRLDDFGVSSWGVDFEDTEFSTKVLALTESLLGDELNTRIHLQAQHATMAARTFANLSIIRRAQKG